jgi:hypothetical protein
MPERGPAAKPGGADTFLRFGPSRPVDRDFRVRVTAITMLFS